jgi:ribonuclease E
VPEAANAQDGQQESHDGDHNGGAEDGAPADAHGQSAAAGEVGRDGVRRRRRGRRGGRRNRHGRNGDAPRTGIDVPINEAPAAEPGLRHAVEDLDRPPAPYADERPPLEQLSPAFEPPPAPPAATTPETEAPRRRSTIRESFGTASPSAGAPASAPVISSTGSEEAATPKRGWWGRRLLGDKN